MPAFLSLSVQRVLGRLSTVMLLATALTVATEAMTPAPVQAQCMGPGCAMVSVDGKAMVGMGLVGVELGLIIPAIAGVRDEWWPYLVFPLVGAAAGIAGGWGIEEVTRPNDAEVDVAVFVIGMALLVPTIVGTLALTAYQPPEASSGADEGPFDDTVLSDEPSVEAVHDESGASDEGGGGEFDDGSSDDGAAPSSRAPSSVLHQLLAGGRGILRFDGSRVLLAAPLPYSAATYTAEERDALRLAPASDFIVPLVSATF